MRSPSLLGRIYVKEGATETDAKQTNQNILLSAMMQMQLLARNSRFTTTMLRVPTVQQPVKLMKKRKLYLRSRGIPGDAAETLLMYAFLNESLEDLADDEFRTTLTDELLSTMPGGDFIRTL